MKVKFRPEVTYEEFINRRTVETSPPHIREQSMWNDNGMSTHVYDIRNPEDLNVFYYNSYKGSVIAALTLDGYEDRDETAEYYLSELELFKQDKDILQDLLKTIELQCLCEVSMWEIQEEPFTDSSVAEDISWSVRWIYKYIETIHVMLDALDLQLLTQF
jgi:hypothetical protein